MVDVCDRGQLQLAAESARAARLLSEPLRVGIGAARNGDRTVDEADLELVDRPGQIELELDHDLGCTLVEVGGRKAHRRSFRSEPKSRSARPTRHRYLPERRISALTDVAP